MWDRSKKESEVLEHSNNKDVDGFERWSNMAWDLRNKKTDRNDNIKCNNKTIMINDKKTLTTKVLSSIM